MDTKQLFMATANAHKVFEFNQLLDGLGFHICSARACGGMPEVEENGDTFEANSILKARALKELVPEGAWVLSDDSGLEVDALNGAPGIYSARYAGLEATDGENVEKLLMALNEVPPSERTARFRCVITLIDANGVETSHAGSCEGMIAEAVTGEAGFGYDPLFMPQGETKSFAELGDLIKQQLSHRARAVEALRVFLKA
jgi:XTP/dITP diphosphohydrolase